MGHGCRAGGSSGNVSNAAWWAAAAAGAVHVLIFAMESLFWTTPAVRARFRQTAESAQVTRLFAFNQGFYNLFLAIGVFAGLYLASDGNGAGTALVWWSCACMLGASIVLLLSAPGMWRGAVIQGAAPLVFVVIGTVA